MACLIKAIASITNQMLMIKNMTDENNGETTLAQPKNNQIQPRWSAGQSGNPNGRPKGSGVKLDDVLNEMLERDVSVHDIIKDKKIREAMGLGSRAKVAQVITAIVLRQAFEGKKYAVELLFDRNSGKAKQDVTVNQGAVAELTDAQLDERLQELLAGQRIVDVSQAITQPEVVINADNHGTVPLTDHDSTTISSETHSDDVTLQTVSHETVDGGAQHGR